MPKFYFTYGSKGHPFVGGWTEVEAPDIADACALFSAIHPDKDGFMDCCSTYGEDRFKATCMYRNGNLGHRCHETIALKREPNPEDDDGEQ